APQGRRLQARRRRHVGADHLEHAADEAGRRPVRQGDAAARAQHPQHLAGGAVVVGREHDAERRQHDVEAGVREGQRLGVGQPELDRQSFGLRPRTTLVEQRLHVVGRGHDGVAPGGGQRGIAVAGGDVQDGLAGAHVGGFGERLADDLQRDADGGVVAARPCGLLALLDGGEVGYDLLGDGAHGVQLLVGCRLWSTRLAATDPWWRTVVVDAFPDVVQICPCVRRLRPAASRPGHASARLARYAAPEGCPMSHDPLSDVLRNVRLRGAVFYYVSFSGEWAAGTPPSPLLAEALMPGAEHVLAYHLMVRGDGWAAADGQAPVRMATGDIVMFPRGDAHVISCAPGMHAREDESDWRYVTRNDPKPIAVAYHRGVLSPGLPGPADDAGTLVVCGLVACDRKPVNPLIAALPAQLVLPAGSLGPWTMQLLDQAVAESRERRPGSAAVLERASEFVFIDATRRYLETLPPASAGWLGALRDRHVGH